ncbi:type I polyketide synthase [Streptomyces sp. NPDC057362]|uniref:type I polyketide synthase n=1 Tax=Streptomyces sp. NPDC057362 TaxID=3346106 RepID=UPI003626810E
MRPSGIPDIAIVGMGCRFPGAVGVDAFWRLLSGNLDAVTTVPDDRFDVHDHYAPAPGTPGRTVSRHGGFIDDLFGFDAAFFGIAPRHARTMDPQQRILLHVVWEALEDAGILPSTLAGSSTGVFVGQATAEYADVTDVHGVQDVHGMTGSRLRAVSAGRVSFALDARGPSLVVDTACSSSLVAVHLARQSLLTGESDLAVAAGVNAVLSPHDAIVYSQGGMLSPDGRCKFGDTSADGFVRSEGVGAVLLKRLPDALRDGDRVLALLRGSAVTNDGTGSGLLLRPAVSGQVEMVRAACRSAGVTPADLDYLEAHGTGTNVGDGVELRAVVEALAGEADRSAALPIGSVKTNIGHAEAAAGIAGLIKAVLIARHRVIPASLHLRDPHPLLADADPIRGVPSNTELRPAGKQALLGVSSFGLTGTNAHVVVEEFTAPAKPTPAVATSAQDPQLLVLSARSTHSLRLLAERYARHLSPGGSGRSHALRDICHAAAARREAYPYRLWAVGRTHDELAAALDALARGEETPEGALVRDSCHDTTKVAFVFPGQGSQWLGMGRRLLEAAPAFREALTACDEVVHAELGWSVVDVLTDDRDELPSDVAVVQPLLWAVEVALAALLRDKGVEPDVCLGHSMGEAAAAYASGALSLRDAAKVICRRSTLMQRLSGQGSMLSVELNADEAVEELAPYGRAACVAAENAPRATVLAGDAEALGHLAARLEARGIPCRQVKVNVASHSPGMEALRDDLLAALADLSPSAPTTEMFSSVRCRSVAGAELDAAYWMENLRERVRFVESVRTVAKDRTVFVEVSPHSVVTQALAATLDEQNEQGSAVPLLRRRQDETENVIRALGQIFSHGGRIDWNRCFGGSAPHVPLPTYAWDTEQYRQEQAGPELPQRRGHTRNYPMRALGLDGIGAGVTVRDRTPVPPTVYIKAVIDAARSIPGCGKGVLENIELGVVPVELMHAEQATVHVTFEASALPGVYSVGVTVSAPGIENGEALCLAGTFRADDEPTTGADAEDLDAFLTRCVEYVPRLEFYRRAEARGYVIDEALRTVDRLWRRNGEAAARLLPAQGGAAAGLEAALLVMTGAWPQGDDATTAFIPVSIGYVRVVDQDALSQEHWSLARFAPQSSGDNATCKVVLTAPDGRVLAEFGAMELRRWPDEPLPHIPAQRSAPPPPRREAARPAASEPAPTPASDAGDALAHVASVLGVSVSRLDTRQPLRALGLDSLLATELRLRLTSALGIDVTAKRLLGDEPIGDLLDSLHAP